MSLNMGDSSPESVQQRIQIARRDAEALKDRIKRKKDELADTTRTCHFPPLPSPPLPSSAHCSFSLLVMLHADC